MSFSYREGKDEVHFITKEDVENYNKGLEQQVSSEVHEQYPGAVSETGEINWECPCLGGLGTEGPCVPEFRSAFSCWMFSDEDKKGGEKGDDCVDNFFAMSLCMQANEEFYNDLSARNKAAAAEAEAKWEEEQKKMIEEAGETQKAIEGESDVKAIEGESEGPPTESEPAELEPAVEPEPVMESVEPEAAVETTITLTHTISSLPEETFSKTEYSSAIVAATSNEEEQDAKESEQSASAGS